MAASLALRAQAPRRVLDGFGRAVRATCRYAAPRTVDELADTLARTRREGLTVALRVAGRSHGDAALNAAGLMIDTTAVDRMHHWDPETGIVDAEPGFTIESLWRRTLMDGCIGPRSPRGRCGRHWADAWRRGARSGAV